MMLRPSPDLYVRFPAEWRPRYLIFVDTEEEFDWSKPRRRDSTSVEAVKALPDIHKLMSGYGAKPVYLVDYPVTADDRAVDVLGGFRAEGTATIGSQLHPWVNPPFLEPVSAHNSFPGNLPRGLERAKIEALTSAITERFGERPSVYRAGRYGVGPNTEALLDEAGYKLDVSVRPFFDYRGEGGPNFRRIAPHPYWTGPEQRLLELPLSSAFTGGLRRLGEPAFRLAERVPHLNGLLSRTQLLSRIALTPEGIPAREAVPAVEQLVRGGAPVISISFHSPSVEPGNTPYVRDETDLKAFFAWFDAVLTRLSELGVTPISVEDFVDECRALRSSDKLEPAQTGA